MGNGEWGTGNGEREDTAVSAAPRETNTAAADDFDCRGDGERGHHSSSSIIYPNRISRSSIGIFEISTVKKAVGT